MHTLPFSQTDFQLIPMSIYQEYIWIHNCAPKYSQSKSKAFMYVFKSRKIPSQSNSLNRSWLQERAWLVAEGVNVPSVTH